MELSGGCEAGEQAEEVEDEELAIAKAFTGSE